MDVITYKGKEMKKGVLAYLKGYMLIGRPETFLLPFFDSGTLNGSGPEGRRIYLFFQYIPLFEGVC